MRIMISGKKGTGKDEAVKYLISKYGGVKMSFAKPIYDMMYFCQTVMGLEKVKDREFLTTMGDFFRAKDPDIFTNRTFCLADRHNQQTNIYISDGRYENELDGGTMNGFYIVRVVSNDNIRQIRRPNESIIDSHSSENGYPDDYPFDITISNNGTLEEFHTELDRFVQSLSEEK